LAGSTTKVRHGPVFAALGNRDGLPAIGARLQQLRELSPLKLPCFRGICGVPAVGDQQAARSWAFSGSNARADKGACPIIIMSQMVKADLTCCPSR